MVSFAPSDGDALIVEGVTYTVRSYSSVTDRTSRTLKKSVQCTISGSWQRTVPGSAVRYRRPPGTREESAAV